VGCQGKDGTPGSKPAQYHQQYHVSMGFRAELCTWCEKHCLFDHGYDWLVYRSCIENEAWAVGPMGQLMHASHLMRGLW
jgi:hypothetical protein